MTDYKWDLKQRKDQKENFLLYLQERDRRGNTTTEYRGRRREMVRLTPPIFAANSISFRQIHNRILSLSFFHFFRAGRHRYTRELQFNDNNFDARIRFAREKRKSIHSS